MAKKEIVKKTKEEMFIMMFCEGCIFAPYNKKSDITCEYHKDIETIKEKGLSRDLLSCDEYLRLHEQIK